MRLLHNLFEWLSQQRYLASNPWSAIDRSAAEGDEPADETTSRALSVEAYETLLNHAVQAGLAGAAPRNRFLVEFLRHTGLRASELVAARVEDLRHDEWGYSLAVVGKGRQRRTVTLSRPAVTACETYFETRGLRFPEADQPTLPLVAATTDPLGCVSYPSLYASFRAFVRSAFADTPDAGPGIGEMKEATLHWLRHTFATRSAEAEMPEDVLMAELGHRSRETTARYYTSQARRRRAEMERAAASDRTGSRNGEPNDA